ncbi:MAG: type III secretion protein [Janthinobacterium lividum]
MYEAIERHLSDFNDLQNLVSDPSAGARVNALVGALQTSAQAVGDAQGGTDIDRSNRAKIYRGLLAAGRIVEQLREREMSQTGA